jgi:hypothetical protein
VKHRLENPGKLPLEIIEVQSGPYLGEDDIVRFEDCYGRIEQEPAGDAPRRVAEAQAGRGDLVQIPADVREVVIEGQP